MGDVKVCGSVAATLAILCEDGNSKVKHVAFKVTGGGVVFGESTKRFHFWCDASVNSCHETF